MSSEWLEADMVVASTTAFESRYGPWQFDSAQLERLADRMNALPMGMVLNHNPSETFRTRNEHAEVRIREDGVAELRVACLVHASDYESWMERVREKGAPGGMSVAVTDVLASPEGPIGLVLIGDAADFSEDLLLEVARESPGPTMVQHLFQFSADAEAVRMVLGFTTSVIIGIQSELIAAWITHAVGTLRRVAKKQGRPAALDVDITGPGGETVRVRYEPQSDEAAVEIVTTVMRQLFPTD